MKNRDFRNKKFDIVILAGQSNAEGNGIIKDNSEHVIFNEQYEMVDQNPFFYDETDPKNVKFVCKMPIETEIRNLQQRLKDGVYYNDLSISFVNKYIENGYLEKNRNILVIKAAVFGSGFTKKLQGVNNILYTRLIEMIDEALSLNKENKIVAFLWHQGEHDAFENIGKSKNYVYNFYKDEFLRQTLSIFEKYNKFNFPFICGGFCNSWASLEENKIPCEMVINAINDAGSIIPRFSFVETNDLKSNSEDIEGSDDNIHFSSKSLELLGERYFAEWKKWR